MLGNYTYTDVVIISEKPPSVIEWTPSMTKIVPSIGRTSRGPPVPLNAIHQQFRIAKHTSRIKNLERRIDIGHIVCEVGGTPDEQDSISRFAQLAAFARKIFLIYFQIYS
jgi:hypothetical protein